MRRLPTLLVLAALVAGCSAPDPDVESAAANLTPPDVVLVARAPAPNASAPALSGAAPPLPPASTLARLPFGLPVELPLVGDIGGGEPNVAALDDGTLFVASPAGGTGAPNVQNGAAYLWRSTDGGASWDTLRAPSEGPALFCSCDADVVTSPDGWTYYADWWIAPGFLVAPGNYLVEASPDGGATWTSAPITTREALGSSVDRQWLVAGEDGLVGLFYAYFGPPLVSIQTPVPDTSFGIHAVFSRDHGATWGDPVVVVPPGALQIAHPRILSDGTLVMPYGLVDAQTDFWNDPSMIMLAVSTDGGATWTQKEVAPVPKGFDNLWAVQGAVDGSDAIHVAAAARIDKDRMGVYVLTSRDAGDTWTEALALRDTGLNFLPWVAATGNGTVAVAWYGGDSTGDPAKAEKGATWYAYVAQSTDGGESFLVQRVSDEPVKADDFCPRGAACRGDRELLDYPSLVYDAQGTLHVAFARSDKGVAQTLVASALQVMS